MLSCCPERQPLDITGWMARAIKFEKQARDASALVERAETRTDELEEALHKIASWSDAYPLTVFPEPDLKKARELLAGGGITLDSISAHCMRHVVEGVGKIAKGALSSTELPGGEQ
jgi:hypothetical protein